MADSIEIYQRGNWPTIPPTHQVGHGSRAGDEIKIWDLENIIYFTDAQVLADTMTALGASPTYPHVRMSPTKARQLLGITIFDPYANPGNARDPNCTIWIDFPMNRTHYYDPPVDGGFWHVKKIPVATSAFPFGFNPNDLPFLDENSDWFIVNGWESPAAINWPYPPYRFQWTFQLMQYGGAFRNPPTAPPAPPPIQQRRWIEGFEGFPDGAGGSGSMQVTRDASRHVMGYGAAVRNDSNSSWLKQPGDFGAATPTKQAWQRGYMRLRRLPDTDGFGNTFWRCTGGTSPANFNNLRVNTLGQLEICTTAAVLGTSPALPLNAWQRLDILFNYSSGAGGTFQLYLDHQLAIDLSGILSNGIGQNQNYLSTALGAPDPSGARGLWIDLDDWMEAPIPPSLDGMDWLMGGRIMHIRAVGVASSVNWTGDFRGPIGEPVLSTNALMQCTVPSSTVQFNTDWHDQQVASATGAAAGETTPSGAAPLFQNGCAAAVLGFFCQGPGGTSQFRIRDGAGNIVGSNGILVGGQAFYNAMYRPSGMVTPNVLGAVTMEWQTGAAAGTNNLYMAHMQAEDLGIFGVEDINPTISPPPPTVPQYTGIHNAPYPRSPWALVGGAPQSNVMIAYGLYTGNGTGDDLDLPYPPAWLYIRPVTPAGASGVKWWSSEFTGHLGVQPGINSASMPQALQDSTFQDAIGPSLARRAGTGTQENASGNTYQYVAFCDPGQRFVTNGVISAPATIASVITSLGRLANFTPEAGFFNCEQVGTLSTPDFWYKGIGHAGAFATRINTTAEQNNVVTFGTGQITSQTPLHQSGTGGRAQTAFSLWRQNDGVSSGPSQGRVVAISSYVGDGTASRVITLDLGGHYPVYAQVVPHNATAAFVRDPSHTGTTSCQMGNMVATSTTAITAGGINQITVGITLNANGVTYDVFVLPGCSLTGWDNNGGDFCPLNYGGYVNDPPEPYIPSTTVDGNPDLCTNDWETPRSDGLPYVPLMPGSSQDEHQ